MIPMDQKLKNDKVELCWVLSNGAVQRHEGQRRIGNLTSWLFAFFLDQMIDKTKVEKSEAKATELEKKVCMRDKK